MGELVNLKRARKRRTKSEAAQQAELNRVRFGRTKSERKNESAQKADAAKKLDQHELPKGDAT